MCEILSESEYALLTYYEDRQLLELIWKTSCPCEGYMKTFYDAIKYGKNKIIQFFLSDIRNEGIVPMENLRWMRMNIIPQAAEFGIRKIALVMKEEVFAHIYSDLLEKNISEYKMNMKTFFKTEDALKWLK